MTTLLWIPGPPKQPARKAPASPFAIKVTSAQSAVDQIRADVLRANPSASPVELDRLTGDAVRSVLGIS